MSTTINVTVDDGGLPARNKQQVAANRQAYTQGKAAEQSADLGQTQLRLDRAASGLDPRTGEPLIPSSTASRGLSRLDQRPAANRRSDTTTTWIISLLNLTKVLLTDNIGGSGFTEVYYIGSYKNKATALPYLITPLVGGDREEIITGSETTESTDSLGPHIVRSINDLTLDPTGIDTLSSGRLFGFVLRDPRSWDQYSDDPDSNVVNPLPTYVPKVRFSAFDLSTTASLIIFSNQRRLAVTIDVFIWVNTIASSFEFGSTYRFGGTVTVCSQQGQGPEDKSRLVYSTPDDETYYERPSISTNLGRATVRLSLEQNGLFRLRVNDTTLVSAQVPPLPKGEHYVSIEMRQDIYGEELDSVNENPVTLGVTKMIFS